MHNEFLRGSTDAPEFKWLQLGVTVHRERLRVTAPSENTMWHEIFAGVYFCGFAIFFVFRELIFAIRTDWFFLLGINFCDFQKVPSTQH